MGEQATQTAPEFLTVHDFAGAANLSTSHVYRLLKANEIPHKKFGRTIRIPRSALVVTSDQ